MDEVPEITATELHERLARGDRPALVDVREPYEWEIGNLGSQGAKLIPMAQVAERLGELDPQAETVVYCRSGSRSARVVQQLRAAGFGNVWNLAGGILAWSEEVDPSMPRY